MNRSRVRIPVALASVAVALGLGAHPASARGLALGFGDRAFKEAGREVALDRALSANAEFARINVAWSSVAPTRPANPVNPADPAYRFAEIDNAVRAAASRGLTVLLEVGNAPPWAEGPNRPSFDEARAGTWRPDPVAYGQFARAVATRYSGAFSPGLGQAPLPAVTRFQAGNEPNLATYLTPQWSGGRLESARLYRELLTSFYDAVKAVSPAAVVVTAGTGPYGEDPGGRRSRPLAFLREMLCLNGSSLSAAGCSRPVPFDVLAHHPINASEPFRSADHPDDATTPDIGEVRGVLRRAEKLGRVRPAGGHPIWVTEFWWESDPPDARYGVPERTHARYVAEALYLFWKQRVPVVLGLQLADDPIDDANPGDTFQTGLYFADGRPKDALTAFRFPVVATKKRRRTRVWGRAPAAGRLAIQIRRDGRWRTAKRMAVQEAKVFNVVANGPGRSVRARVAGARSLPYRIRAAN